MDLETEKDSYKDAFKHYKFTPYEQVASSVIDTQHDSLKELTKVEISMDTPEMPHCAFTVHFKPFVEWKMFLVNKAVPGLFIIPNIIKEEFRSEWFTFFRDEFPLSETLDLKANVKLEKTKLPSLRWITFGYHHDWDTKMYHLREQQEIKIPGRVQDLCLIASAYMQCKFRPEAGIVNYYRHNSSLCFHSDYSELNHQAPLLSLSLGSPAIFLIGGLTKDSTHPIVPILLRDSDLLIMSGESRLALHAIPKIVTHADGMSKCNLKADSKSKIHRININVRQVF